MRRFIPLAFIFILVLLIYSPILSLYFSQDDFFHFKISQTNGSQSAFLNLLSFRPFSERGGIYFYRPVFREALFNIYQNLFGLNAVPFRITQFILHLLNIGLTYVLVNKLTKNRFVAWVGAGVFGLSPANVGVLSYLAGGIQASGMTAFFLASVIFFLNFLESGEVKHKTFSFTFFLFALASHELALVLPFVLVGLTVLKGGKIREVVPYFVASTVLILLEIRIIGLPSGEKQYGVNLSPLKLLNAYGWYFIWGLGIPEMLLDFIGPGIRLNANLFRFWGDFFRIIFPFFLVVIIFILVSLKRVIKDKLFWFFLFWFVVGISPVVFLPLHKSTYYLAPVLPAIGGIIGLITFSLRKKSKFLAFAFLVTLFIMFVISKELSFKTHWAVQRGIIAERLVREIRYQYPALPMGANVYIKNDPNYPFIAKEWGGTSTQAFFILSGSDALQVLYDDRTLKVYYQDKDKIPQGTIYPFVAKIQ